MKRKLWILAVMIMTVLLFSAAAADGAVSTEMVMPDEDTFSAIPDVSVSEQPITVSFDKGENINKYRIVVKDIDGDGTNGYWNPVIETDIEYDANSNKVSYTIPGTVLTCGNGTVERLFAIEVWAIDANGKAESFLFHVVAVVPQATATDSIALYTTDINNIEGSTPQARIGLDNFFIVADAPGAKCVWITVDGETEQGKPGENTFCRSVGFWKAGTYEYYATALYENADGTTRTVKSATKTVEAIAIEETVGDDTITKLQPTITWKSEVPEGSWTAGNDIQFTIGKVSNTIKAEENVWYGYGLFDYTVERDIIDKEFKKQHDYGTPTSIETILDEDEKGKDIVFPSSLLTVGHRYQAWIYVSSCGKEPYIERHYFTVVPATEDGEIQAAPTLKMKTVADGEEVWSTASTAAMSVPLRKTQTFKVELADGQDEPRIFRYWNNNYFEYRDWEKGAREMTFDVDFWWADQHAVFAQLYYEYDDEVDKAEDWERDLTWKEPTSNTIHVDVTVNGTGNAGRATPVEFELVDANGTALSTPPTSMVVEQGEYLRIKLKNTVNPENYEYIYATLINGDHEEYGWFFQNTDEIYVLPTAMLEPGYYTLCMTAAQVGKNDSYTNFYFQVKAKTGATNETVFFTTDKTTVNSYDPFSVAFFAPEKKGWDRHYIFYVGDEERTDDQWDREGYGAFECDLDPGEWELKVEAVYTKEGEEDIIKTSETITMTANSAGDPTGLALIVPEVVVIDEDDEDQKVTITINGLTNDMKGLIGRNWWEVDVSGDFEDGGVFNANSDSDELQSSYEIPISEFRVGENYRARVHYNIRGYNSYHAEASFSVVESVSDAVTLSIKDIEANANDVYELTTNVDEEFVVSWGDNPQPQAIRFHNNNGWDFRGDYNPKSNEGSYSFGCSFESGDQSVYAQVAYQKDEADKNWIWTDVTKPLKLHVTGKGEGPKPVCQFVVSGGAGEPEQLSNTITITRGDLMKVKIVSASDTINNETVTATQFHGWIRDMWYNFNHADINLNCRNLPTYLTFPTASLEKGTYYVQVDSCLEEYDWNGTELKFKVVEPTYGEGEEPFILNVQEPVYAHDQFSISAYEPNASNIDLVIHYKADGEDTSRDEVKDWFEGNSADDYAWVDRGTYEIYAVAHYKDSEETRTSTKKEITAGYKTPGLTAPVITVDETFTKNADNELLEFTVSNLEQANSDNWYLEIYDANDREARIKWSRGTGNTFTVNANDLTASHAYCIEAKVYGPGYEEQQGDAIFVVLSGNEDTDWWAPELLINGRSNSSETIDWQVGKEYTLRVYAPSTATAVRVMTENGWQYFSGNTVDQINNSGRRGTYTFIAQACYETNPNIIPWADENFDWDTWNANNGWRDFDWGQITDWGSVSNSIRVNFASSGMLDIPTLSLTYPEETGLTRGVTLTATVGEVTNAEKYRVTVKRLNEKGDPDDGDDDYRAEASAAGSFDIPTDHLKAGVEYGVWASVAAEGYFGNESILKGFILNEPEKTPSARLEISKPSIMPGENVTIYAYYPDKAENEQLVVLIRKINENGWTNDKRSDKPGDFWEWSTSQVGTYKLTLYRSIRIGEQENLIEVNTDSQTLVVSAENGSIGEVGLSGIDGVINKPIESPPVWVYYGIKGEDDTLSTDDVDEFDIKLDYMPESGNGYNVMEFTRKSYDADVGTLRISEDDLGGDGIYRLGISARKQGWSENGLEYKFLVTSEGVNDNVTLKVNGGTSDIDDWKNESFIHVEVEAPEDVTAIRIMDDGNWRYYTGNHVDETNWSYDRRGDYTLVAQVSTTNTADATPWMAEDFNWNEHPDFWNNYRWEDSGLEWSDISNKVTVHVTTGAQLDVPTISIKQEGQTSIALGEPLTVTIGEVSNAEEYFISVDEVDENGFGTDNREIGFGFSTFKAGDVAIPTIRLEAGHRYGVAVMCKAVGYENSFTSDYVVFTVTANGALEESFSISPTQVKVNESFAISIYAPGARNIRFCHANFDNGWAMQGGDTLADTRSISQAGNYVFLAFAEYANEDSEGENEWEWRLVGEPITVTATAIEPATPITASIDLLNTVFTETSTGSDAVSFALKIKAGKTRYDHSVDLYRVDDMGWQAALTLGSFGPISNNAVYDYEYNYSVPLKNLPAGNYCIRAKINPRSAGQEEIELRQEITVRETEATTTGTLKINGGTGPVSIQKQSDMTVLVSDGSNKQVTAFRVYIGENRWETRVGDNSNDIRSWNEGVYPIYAQYTTEEIDWNSSDHEHDWDNVNWTGYTNTVMVTVTSQGKLSMPEITITPSNRPVKRGESIIITLGAETDTGNVWYGASIQDVMDGQSPYGYFGWDETERTITLPTARLTSGNYIVNIGKDGTGAQQVNTNVSVVVEEADARDVLVYVDKVEVHTLEEAQWEVYAPGATGITVKGYREDREREDDYLFENDNIDWEDTTSIGGQNNFGGHEGKAYIVATATYADNSTKTTVPIEITVTAPNGDLNPNTVRSGLYYGGDVSITVEPDARAEWYQINDIYMYYEGNEDANYSVYEEPEFIPGNGNWNRSFSGIGDAHIGVMVYQAAEGFNDVNTTIWLRPITTTGQITLPSMLTTIEDEAFADNPSITHVIIPDNVTSIGNKAFQNCPGLWTIEIPRSVTSIGEDALWVGNITIYGYSGSYAETYAQANDIDFVRID